MEKEKEIFMVIRMKMLSEVNLRHWRLEVY